MGTDGNIRTVFALSNGNLRNLRTPNTEEARAMQLKSAQKRSQNIKEKKVIREIIEKRLGVDDLNEIVDNLIARAKTDSKDFEVLQTAMGQKPKEEISLEGGVAIIDDVKDSSP